LGLLKFILYAYLASHRVVVCAERNRIFFTFTIIVSGVIVVVVIVIVIVTTSTVSSAVVRFRKIARFKNSFMSRTWYEPSEIVVSASSLAK